MLKNLAWFSNNLIYWYLENKRNLPWRETNNPYAIWLSEIMLQQTRVEQGLPYYNKFINHYPTVIDLANASEEEVLKLWQGLGYYSRARNLHKTAKFIAFERKGLFPSEYEELLKLKGIGDYTASAIASICFDAPTAVVDGNVYRVLSRVFGIETPTNSTNGIKEFKNLAQKLIDTSQPGTYNQAIMEFGARFCTPNKPDCFQCIFKTKCIAYKEDKVSLLPTKKAKTKIKKEFYNYLVFLSKDEKTILKKRTYKGIWQNLYQFPLIEADKKWTLNTLKESDEFKEITNQLNIEFITKFNDAPIVHKLSHKHLFTTFWIINTDKLIDDAIPYYEIETLPVPVLIDNFISNFEPFKK